MDETVNGENSSPTRRRVKKKASKKKKATKKKKASKKRKASRVTPLFDAYQPFPTEVLPRVLKEYISEASEAISCDQAYVALPLLTAVGAMIGNARRLIVKAGTWYALPTIWTAIIGESGTAKSPALSAALAPIKRIQAELLRAFEVELEEYKEQLREAKADDSDFEPQEPRPIRYLVQDTTVEALAPILESNEKGVLLYRDELAGWFGSFNKYTGRKGADESDWLSMHSGESITVDRKGQGTAPLHVQSAVVSITGGIQPAILGSNLSAEYRASGLAARILMASPPRVASKWTEQELSKEASDELNALFDNLKDLEMVADDEGNLRSVEVAMSDDAKTIWTRFYNEHNEEQADLESDEAAAWSKLLTYVPRLALLIHLVRKASGENANDDVDSKAITIAITLVDWFKSETLRTYAMLDESNETAELRKIYDWIVNKHSGQVTPREVVQGVKKIDSVEEAELVLIELSNVGLGEWQVDNNTGGRPKRSFRAY